MALMLLAIYGVLAVRFVYLLLGYLADQATDDSSMPTAYLSAPLFLVLDGTRSEDAVTRRAAEAWMRCSFKSYLR